ncbi:MAG: DUF3455 domain-containing protein [Usitatibacter sp.]
MNRHALAVLMFAAAIPCAMATVAVPARISDALRVPADEQAAFVLNADGVQIYACKPRAGDPYAYQWAFVAPEATLIENGETVGHHGAGPTWESTIDHSSVKGAAVQRQDGGAGNIPWLLLAGTPAQVPGKFAGVTSVQRVATEGGVEPAGGCDASNAGKEVRVPYKAQYYFYKRG